MRKSKNPGAATAAGAVALALSLASTAPAMAQGSSSPKSGALGLEEVTVTARKVEENMMTVPVAITAFSAKTIEDQGIKQLNDVMRMTPGFNFVNQQGSSGRNDRSSNSLVFRGLYLASNTGINSGGQLFIDGAPVLGAQPPPIVDVARIEVLKGPQSAYFGRSTFAGAVNFIMQEPAKEFGAKVSAEVGSFESHDASLTLEGPLFGDTLAGRITLRDFKRGGQFRNPGELSQRLGEQTTQSVSGSLVWTPTESLKVKAHVSMFEDDDGPPANGALKIDNFSGRVDINGNCVPFSQAPAGTAALGQTAGSRASFGYFCGTLPGLSGLPANIVSGDWNTSRAATQAALFTPNPNWNLFNPGFKRDGGLRRKATQADLRVDWEFGGGYTLSSLTATHFDKNQVLIDLDYRDGRDRPNPLYALNTAIRVPWQQFLLVSQGRTKDWSEELRVTSPSDRRFRWTLGANYSELNSAGGPVYGISIIGPLFASTIARQEAKTPAVFGGAYFDFTDSLTLSLEARYQEDEVSQIPIIGTSGQPVTGANATVLSNTFNSFSPRISLDWNYAPNSTLYGTFSRGIRPGGFNGALVTSSPATVAAILSVVPTAQVAYEEEELDNYELGLKSSWLNGRARTQLTLFKLDWKNGQVANSIPVPGATNLIGLTINNGTAEIKGAEFEGEIRATEHLRLAATVGYSKSEIKTYGVGAGNCLDCNLVWGSFAGVIGNSLPTTPKLTWSLSGDYSAPLTGSLDWYGRADYSVQGSKYTDFSNVAKVGSQENANLRFGLRNARGSIEAFVTNLTDDDTVQAAILGIDAFSFLLPPNKNELRFSPNMPRMYGLRATYNFGATK